MKENYHKTDIKNISMVLCGIYNFSDNINKPSYSVYVPSFPSIITFSHSLEEAIQTTQDMLQDTIVNTYLTCIKTPITSILIPVYNEKQVVEYVKQQVEEVDEIFNKHNLLLQYVLLSDMTMSILRSKVNVEEIKMNEQIAHTAKCWAAKLGMSYDEYFNYAIYINNERLTADNNFILKKDN